MSCRIRNFSLSLIQSFMQTSSQSPRTQACAPGMSSKNYFMGVALLSFICLTWYISSKPLLKQQLGQAIGITKPQQPSKNSFYPQRVQAVLDEYCIACHNNKKAKGALRLDDYFHTRYSGKSGRAVVPFQLEGSAILTRMSPPENDKRLMPPLGWETPKKNEKRILELWIEKGATLELSTAEVPEAPALIRKIVIPTFNAKQVAQTRLQYASIVEKLMQRFPHSLRYIARDSHKLRFSSVSLPAPFNDEHLKQLAPIATQLDSLYLPNANLTDASIETLLLMSNLSDAYLPHLIINEKDLITFITQQHQLKRLSLSSSVISTRLKELCSQKNIRLSELSHAQ